MPDLLVKLYELPDISRLLCRLQEQGISIRRALLPERRIIAQWVSEHFNPLWADEADAAVSQEPSTCFVAVQSALDQKVLKDPYDLPHQQLVGFACYNARYKGLFGPIGVREDYRGKGIGKALLVDCLKAMWELHYAYAVIYWAGPVEFYSQAVGATVIPDSEPGPFQGYLIG